MINIVTRPFGPAFLDRPAGHKRVTELISEWPRHADDVFTLNAPLRSFGRPVQLVIKNPYAAIQHVAGRRLGLNRGVVFGPNIQTAESAARLPHVLRPDIRLVPSDWVARVWANIAPSEKIHVWPIGLDLKTWPIVPSIDTRRLAVLYLKSFVHTDKFDLPGVIRHLEKRGWRVQVVPYGFYSFTSWLDLLREAKLLVCFGSTESQGIFLQEAWASDVPTLVLRNDSYRSADGFTFPASSAPYMTEHLGAFFSTEDQLLSQIKAVEAGHFSPRENYPHHLTLEGSMKLLRTIIAMMV